MAPYTPGAVCTRYKVPQKTRGEVLTLLSDSHLGSCDVHDSHALYLARQLQAPEAICFHKLVLFVGNHLCPLRDKYLGFPYSTIELKQPFG